MAWMDMTRCKAVANVIAAIAPWMSPRPHKDDGLPVVELQFLPYWAVLATPGKPRWRLCHAAPFSPDGPVPRWEELHVTISDGAQVAAGHILANLLAAYERVAKDPRCDEGTRQLAAERAVTLGVVDSGGLAVADYTSWLIDLTAWAAEGEFRRIAAQHAEEGGGLPAARALVAAAAPGIRARLAAVRDEQIEPLLRGAKHDDERSQLQAGMVLFTHEAEDRLTGTLMEWLQAGAPPARP